MARQVALFEGTCPECDMKLVFRRSEPAVECPSCGQRHDKSALKDVNEIEAENALRRLRIQALRKRGPKKGTGFTTVKGITTHQCKLLSPLLTTYGMDRSGEPKLLRDLPNQGEVFDCAALCDRSFEIEPEFLETKGYGLDKGGMKYLEETLEIIRLANKSNSPPLVPLHSDGDGHCLVHAISRCLVGRELFWHALRVGLHNHLQEKLEDYRRLLSNFFPSEDWAPIVEEADPKFRPTSDQSFHGLRTVHIFALANVLRRPIILLDSVECMSKTAVEYCSFYLPLLHNPNDCRGRGKSSTGGETPELNPPIVVAWSSAAHNHFIPLVPVKGNQPVVLPADIVPKIWGNFSPECLSQYVQVRPDDSVGVYGEKKLSDGYLSKLIRAMEGVFVQQHDVSPRLVGEVEESVYRQLGELQLERDAVIEVTKRALKSNRLYRCLSCNALAETPVNMGLEEADLVEGGSLEQMAEQSRIQLADGSVYQFPLVGVKAKYNGTNRRFEVIMTPPICCLFCGMTDLRQIRPDSSIIYVNGDRTTSPAKSSRCGCGYKHYWDGKEYDNLPFEFPIKLDWQDRSVTAVVEWFEDESDPSLNSNAYEIAQHLVNKHFPGEFGSERLVQRVVDLIMRLVVRQENRQMAAGVHAVPVSSAGSSQQGSEDRASVSSSREEQGAAASPDKIILSGFSKTSLHKEELTKSQAERDLRRRISENAQLQRRRASPGKGNDEPAGKLVKSSDPKSSKTASPLRFTTAASSSGAIVTTTSDSSQPRPAAAASATSSMKSKVIKIRLTTPSGDAAMLELSRPVQFGDLQLAIEETLHIPPVSQRLRLGFPPKELHLSPEEEVQLQHGDKLSVENTTPLRDASSTEATRGEGPHSPHGEAQTMQTTDAPATSSAAGGFGNTASLASSSTGLSAYDNTSLTEQLTAGLTAEETVRFAILQMASLMFDSNTDYWHQFWDKPGDFKGDGVVVRSFKFTYPQSCTDGQHFTLPAFPNKIFVYNKRKERIELCLGEDHVAIEDVTPAMLPLAHTAHKNHTDPTFFHPALTSGSTAERSSLRAGGSGHVNAAQSSLDVFSGQGHRLSGSVGQGHRLSGSAGQGHRLSGSAAQTSQGIGGGHPTSQPRPVGKLAEPTTSSSAAQSTSRQSQANRPLWAGGRNPDQYPSSSLVTSTDSMETTSDAQTRTVPSDPAPMDVCTDVIVPPDADGLSSPDDVLYATDGSEGEEMVYDSERPPRPTLQQSDLSNTIFELEDHAEKLRAKLALVVRNLEQPGEDTEAMQAERTVLIERVASVETRLTKLRGDNQQQSATVSSQ